MKKKPAQWEPPPLDPRKFDDPYRPKKRKILLADESLRLPGVRKGQILRRASDGILYLAS